MLNIYFDQRCANLYLSTTDPLLLLLLLLLLAFIIILSSLSVLVEVVATRGMSLTACKCLSDITQLDVALET